MIQGKVAVIEDTLLTRTVILDRLKELECEAEGFASFEEFLASPVMAMADLVLMDIELPGISGLEALQRIRARHEGLPVIIITGHGTVERAVEALKAGAFDFFTKPIDFTKLGVAIKNAMRQYRLVREISGMKRR
ncbi:MAG: response regulator, partial [Chlamydiota bacterium]